MTTVGRLILNTWSHPPERANRVRDDGPIDPSDREACAAEILRLVAGGTYLRDACEAVGIGRDTFLDWRLRDAALSTRYFEARASWALVRLDDAMEQLAHATSPVGAAKWRAILTALQWETERLLVQYRRATADPSDATAGERRLVHVIRWEDAPPSDDARRLIEGRAVAVGVLDAIESPESGNLD